MPTLHIARPTRSTPSAPVAPNVEHTSLVAFTRDMPDTFQVTWQEPYLPAQDIHVLYTRQEHGTWTITSSDSMFLGVTCDNTIFELWGDLLNA